MGSGFETSLDDFNAHLGGNAFFSVGKQINDTWDLRVGGAINKLLDSTGSLTWSGSSVGSGSGSGVSLSGFAEGRSAFSFASLDFEVGYTPVLTENQSLRLFAGIRGLYFTRNSEFSSGFSFSALGSGFGSGLGSGSGFQASILSTQNMRTEFIGAGPRLGVSAAHRFDDSNFGLSGTFASALLFGKQSTMWSTTRTSSFSSGGSGSSFSSSFSSSFTTHKVVLDLEAKGGVDYYLNDNTALTIGYRAELLRNVGPYDDMGQNTLVHGPFVSLTGALP
jgi:hypothetical protein